MSVSSAVPPRDQVLRGIGLMVLSMALLALSDVFIKLASRHMPPGQVMILLSTGGTILFVTLAKLQGAPLITRDALHPIVLWRNLMEMFGGLSIILALTYTPLATFASVMQMAPLLVTVGAWALLGEKVGLRRWLAVAAGIAGMLLVIRPGMEGFSPATLWAVMAITALSLRDLITRRAPAHLTSVSLSTWGFAATIPVGFVVVPVMGTPLSTGTAGVWAMLGAIVVTALGYYAITTAMRIAPVSIVAPFRYARLVFTMGLGIMIFDERPDGLTLLGAAIILAAGFYTFLRERQLARLARS